jgi:flavin-dependent dehydrogenase
LIDLAIIGGGPAGAAAALEAIRRGLRAAVWERDRFPRDKVCGEFISAESIPLLEAEIPGALRRSAAITSAEFISARGRAYGFALPAGARGLSRRVLDASLWDAAIGAGARGLEGEAVIRIRKCALEYGNGDGWEVESESGEVERARALVIACGRWWKIEGLTSPAFQDRNSAAGPWLGAKAHFREITPRPVVEMHFFPGGYCGLAPVEDGMTNACCLVHRRLVREAATARVKDFAAWIARVARHPALDERLRNAVQEGDTVTTAPVRPARRRAASNGVLLAGDAAGFLDPFTGDGISMAMHSGRLAAEELARCLRKRETNSGGAARAYEKRMEESMQRSYMLAGMLRALVRAPAAVQESAAAAIPWLGARLLAGTRWRASQGMPEVRTLPESQV